MNFIAPLESRKLFAAVELACVAFSIDAYDPASGNLTFSILVANSGSADTPANAPGGLVLSKDTVINNADDILLGGISPDDTPRFSTKTISSTTPIFDFVPEGDYYLAAALDINSRVKETNELDNYRFSASTIHVPKVFALSFEGTAGSDNIFVNQANGRVTVTSKDSFTYTYKRERVSSVQVNGLAGNDVIAANPLLDVPVYFLGGDGNDALGGGGVNDTLTGGAGKDTLRGTGGNDRLNGNGGNDQIFGETGPDRLFGGAGNDLLDGGSSGDRLDGGAGNDSMFGQGGNDIFTSNDGQIDQLFGGTGKDTSIGDATDVRNSVLG